ncbi:MAG TPA: translation initiation factor [Phycisphaerae bacterium]|jgi:translation initiation factor 1|nr:translation initiation factor [Phycisphaerae bacterium]
MSRLFAGTQFDQPKRCEKCGKLPAECRCMELPEKKKMGKQGVRLDSGLVLTPANSKGPADQVAKIRQEKRKGNRVVTVITGLEHPGNDLPALCTALKQALGVGGSVQGRTVELQGELGEKIAVILEGRGMKARVV